ncbi:MAG: type VI secretion system protein TssA [Methylibium sp.]|uniref:type VI secretion system protein TssA n=1 Tax=Methylibium sp. TaxID=2067992 RepID=UPI0017D4EF0A|nr:type VI secretion system protein TssA [Methylibium sp.]MBA3596204.1 type VI secretion system protein TssA [Methylibium sp.]
MNFDVLLAAVSGPSPCGDDLSFSTEFDAIQEMRRADDPTLDQGEWVTALKSADWTGVLAQCEQLLSQRTKDLRVAAWLTDARARLVGYAGLADGLTLYRLLCEGFWDDLHPRIEDGDAEQRGGSLRWLLAQVESLAPRLPVLRDGTHAYSLGDMASAQALSRSVDPAGEAPATHGRITLDDIAAVRRKTPRGFFVDNLAEVQRAQQALEQLQRLVDERLGDDSPGFAGARSALADAAHAVERLAREADPLGAPANPALPSAEVLSTGRAAAGEAPSTAPLRTRAEALQQLRMVADFFRRTEPHSPVAYLADRAAQWGDMPLHAWLRAVLKDQGALLQVEELLGVPPPVAAE